MTPRQGMPPDTILRLAARPEGFGVTWRDRDCKLMKRCARLVRLGKLVRAPKVRGGGITYFHLPPAAAEERAA